MHKYIIFNIEFYCCTSVYVGKDKHFYFTLFFMNTMISLFILLNLLVLVMLDIFANVLETAESTYYQEIASIMSENEIIVN